MKKNSIAIKSIALVMSMIGISYADDYTHLNDWTGLYAGVEAGYLFNYTQLTSQQLGFTYPSEQCNTASGFSSASSGFQLGYMHQSSNDFVAGIEANVAFNTNQENTLNCVCPYNSSVSDRFSFRNQMQSALKGRLGHAIYWNNNSFLPYLTLGISFANAELRYENEGGDYYSQATTQAGWLIGEGVEWAFKKHWSLRIEYNHIDYGNIIHLGIPSIYGLLDPNGQARIDLSSNNVVASINYWI